MNAEERMKIARTVVPLIRDGDKLMIDAGATTIFVARRLAAHLKGLTVVTTSFGVASALSSNTSINIRICPGHYDPSDGGVTGPDTIDYLQRFQVAHAILGASRMDDEGPSDFNSNSVGIKRAMINQADNVIFVLDHEKLDRTGFERICAMKQVGHLVTDQQPSDRLMTALAGNGVQLHLPS